MPPTLFKQLSVAIIATLTLLATQGQAATCIQGPIALPWLSGPPEWDDFDGDGFWRPELHDPRWSGTPFRYLRFDPSSPAEGFASDSAVRVLEDGNFLYVSFQVMMDDNGPNLNDFVYLAFTEGGAQGAYAVAISMRDSGTAIVPPADPDGAGPSEVNADVDPPETVANNAVVWWHTVDADGPALPVWTPTTGVPAWLQAARWDRSTAGSPRWAMTLRVDLGAIGATGNRKMFFGTNVDVAAASDVIMANTQPIDDLNITSSVGDATIIPEMSTNWEEFVTSGCVTGATIALSDVGVFTGTPGTNPAGALTTQICAGGLCGSGENTFRAIIKNLTTTSDWNVRARFRIADWGSVPAYREFGRWSDISVTPAGIDVFDADPVLLSTANGWYWQDDSVSEAVIDYHCSKGAEDYCPKLVDESHPHQCMLVEIAASQSSPQWIETPGVYRNMDFQDLSSVKREAVISIAGLREILKKDVERKVFLHVSRTNMPAHGKEPLTLPKKAMEFSRRYAADPPTVNPPIRGLQLSGEPNTTARTSPRLTKDQQAALTAWKVRAEQAKRDDAVVERIGRSNERLAAGVLTHHALAMDPEQLLDAVWPTYRVRVFFDDGRTFTENGNKDRVLIPMPPFGFRFQHEGPLFGFTDALAAQTGVNLEPLKNAPDWYQVVIPSEGNIKVTTMITAEEEARRPPAGPSDPGEAPEAPQETSGEVPKVPPTRCSCRVVGQRTSGALWWLGVTSLGLLWVCRRRRMG